MSFGLSSGESFAIKETKVLLRSSGRDEALFSSQHVFHISLNAVKKFTADLVKKASL